MWDNPWLTSFFNLFLDITGLHCLLPNVEISLFHIFCPVFRLYGRRVILIAINLPWSIAKVLISFFKDFYLFLERGKEKERERNINVWLFLMHLPLGTWPAPQGCTLIGIEPATLWFTACTQSTELHQPEPACLFHPTPQSCRIPCVTWHYHR